MAWCDYSASILLTEDFTGGEFIFENGTRDHLIDTHGLSVEEIYNKIENFVK